MKIFLKFLAFLFAAILLLAISGIIHLFVEKTWQNVGFTMFVGFVSYKVMAAFLEKVVTILDKK
jgi:hypothetical protein